MVYAIVALFLTVINVVFVQLISVGGVSPNLLLILCGWFALVEGQFEGMLFGFVVGLVFDIASTDVIGSNALAMTFASFTAGYFHRDGKGKTLIGKPAFIAIIMLISVIYFLIYYTLYIQPSDITFVDFAVKNITASALYTAVFSVFPMLFYSRNMER